jgi:hypothetical protein
VTTATPTHFTSTPVVAPPIEAPAAALVVDVVAEMAAAPIAKTVRLRP